jgi:tRNA (guanosine-2'-O-)-methyltransferase
MQLDEGDYAVHHKLAVWFGSESRGITETAVKRSAMCVSIPMLGMIESLNLGTTSGIVLYEVTKQRREYQRKFARRYAPAAAQGVRQPLGQNWLHPADRHL